MEIITNSKDISYIDFGSSYGFNGSKQNRLVGRPVPGDLLKYEFTAYVPDFDINGPY